MSDTSKATPRPWRITVDPLKAVDLSSRVVLKTQINPGQSIQEAIANLALAVDTVNFYNPQRDKLARELAARLLDGSCPCTCMTCRLNIKKARQLLKLYEQDK